MAVLVSRSFVARLSPTWLASALLVLVGLMGGALCDRAPERPVVHRAGYRVLEADFHMHTTYSDGTLSPMSLVRQGRRRGLDVMGVTEHNTVLAGRIAKLWADHATGEQAPLVIPGEEVTTGGYHLIAIGLTRTVSPDQPIEAVVSEIHRQGGVAIGAHPVKAFQPRLEAVRSELDGVEVMHPIALAGRSPSWRWLDMLTYYEETKPPPAAIGSSDYHFASVLGICRTLVFTDEPADEKSVLDAIRARRTVVTLPDGKLLGAPDLVQALEKDPYQVRSSDYGYRGEGTLDRVTRLVGLLGVVGVVFSKRRRPLAQSG